MSTNPSNPTGTNTDREIVLSRVFDAPRELVWEARTNPKHVAQWWGPTGFTTTIEEMDVRPGGAWKQTMRGPDGMEFPNESIFQEVVKPERIVFSHGGGKKGGPGVHFTMTWTFEQVGAQTKLTIHQLYSTAADRDRVVNEYGAIEGGKQTLGRLADYLPKLTPKKFNALVVTLPSDREILLTRRFHAPRALVWEALTKPEHVVKWWGCFGNYLSVCNMDFRVGGKWHYVMRGPDGKDHSFRGECHEISTPSRLVATECYDEPALGSPKWKTTMTLEEKDGVTILTSRVLHPTKEQRDGHFNSGMEAGAGDSFDRLDGHLRGISPHPAPDEFVLSRTFDAPRELVWKAFTDPEHLQRWWGPKGFKASVKKMDFRPGGIYLYRLQSPDGHEMWGKFVYREIVAPERMVLVNSFSDENGGLTRHPMSPTWPLELLSVFSFAENDGKTTFTLKWSPYNSTDVDRQTFEAFRPNMAGGWTGTLDQLAEYLAKVVKT